MYVMNRIPFAPPPPAAPPLGDAEKYSENGRLYHSFRKGKYMLPCDEVRKCTLLALLLGSGTLAKSNVQAEMDRMDIFHKFFVVARQGQLYSIPFINSYERGPRILDLGTGTGIWAIDMGE